MIAPLHPSASSSFLQWQFLFYIGQANWDGLVLGKAEVRRDGRVECVFQVNRRATPGDVHARLKEECIAWVTEKGMP